MLFNSFDFLLFFPIVTFLYFLLPHRYRWLLLLGSSCFFYMFFKAIYIFILFFTIVIDYWAGIFLEQTKDAGRKKALLVMSFIANIGVLAIFKYFNFFNTNVSGLASLVGVRNPIPYLNLVLPIGLSFHTFQAMSYTIEVYRGNQHAERHFGIYALYVMFYPQLVSGPIERPQRLLHQFHEEHSFSQESMIGGLKLMLWGFFKKVVIADRLAIYVNAVYPSYRTQSGLSLLLATIYFSFQIYCDFSGYSDIAIGSARAMGFSLMTNFRTPYFATSISQFWQRWHISLSTWFRDYIYLPLAYSFSGRFTRDQYFGIRADRWVYILATMTTFSICGLWHGANWTFIIWGGLHGTYLTFALLTSGWRKTLATALRLNTIPRLYTVCKALAVFCLVTGGWILFRADSFDAAKAIAGKIATFRGPLFIKDPTHIILSIVSIVTLLVLELRPGFDPEQFFLLRTGSRISRQFAYAAMAAVILLVGVFDRGQFIYFQF